MKEVLDHALHQQGTDLRSDTLALVGQLKEELNARPTFESVQAALSSTAHDLKLSDDLILEGLSRAIADLQETQRAKVTRSDVLEVVTSRVDQLFFQAKVSTFFLFLVSCFLFFYFAFSLPTPPITIS